ncbi:glycosyltransferase [Helicobacter aurati]|uniref:glycosyltransferase n=1 Tax=Helicobacter aurati TaxID=137778 RepID=UPI0022796D5A|nr:glycosyltransferase [Helicobacter aurati]
MPPPPRFIALKLSRNFGHQNALLAGLHYATNKCDCAISIDCDLQQDEEKLTAFIQKFQSGNDIVLGVRKDRNTDSIFKKYSAVAFYEVMKLLGVKIVKNHADFRLLSNKALLHLGNYTEFHFFLRALVIDMGFKQDVVYFDVKPRFAGDSKYPLWKMLAFAWDGITSFSIKPLRLVSALGAVIFLLSLLFGVYALYVKFFTDNAVYGWASTLILLCFFSGLQLLSLGIIGEYIGKMYQEVKARPKYCIDEIIDSCES